MNQTAQTTVTNGIAPTLSRTQRVIYKLEQRATEAKTLKKGADVADAFTFAAAIVKADQFGDDLCDVIDAYVDGVKV